MPATVTNFGDAGVGSLRALVGNAAINNIDFGPLLASPQIINLQTPIHITHNLTITDNFPLAATVTIDGSAMPNILSPLATSHLFTVDVGVTVTFDRLIFRNAPVAAISGGASITVLNSTFRTNGSSLFDGGGITSTGTITVDNSKFIDNVAANGAAIQGSGAITVTNSTFTTNTATFNGGAIQGSAKGSITATGCVFTSNVAGTDGGALQSNRVTVDTSTFTTNHATLGNGGAITTALGDLIVNDSTLVGNTAGSSGGGIYFGGNSADIYNNTLTQNSAGLQGGGIGLGENFSSYIHEDTIVANTALTPSNGGSGGGIFTHYFNNSPTALQGCIVADNLGAAGVADDFGKTVVNLFSSIDNVIGHALGTGSLLDGINGNQVGVTYLGLDPLASNGGPTQTMAVYNDSPARTRGLMHLAASNDQRGVARPIKKPSDVGAYQTSPEHFVILGLSRVTQDTTVNTAFTYALSLILEDANGNPVPGRLVTFAVVPAAGPNAASGTLSALTATTDARGIVTITATANAFVGTFHVTAHASTGPSGITPSPWRFTLANDPIFTILSGDAQVAQLLTQFAQPLTVQARDGTGALLKGLTLRFVPPPLGPSATLTSTINLTAPDGTITTTTDNNGTATVTATANDTIGSYIVTAVVPDAINGASFHLSNVAPASYPKSYVTTSPSVIQVGQTTTIDVHVLDAQGNPLNRSDLIVGITFSGGTSQVALVSGPTYIGSGIYRFIYRGTVTGTIDQVSASLNATPLVSRPATLFVAPGATLPARTYITYPPSLASLGFDAATGTYGYRGTFYISNLSSSAFTGVKLAFATLPQGVYIGSATGAVPRAGTTNVLDLPGTLAARGYVAITVVFRSAVPVVFGNAQLTLPLSLFI